MPKDVLELLGPIANLAGTWVGNGFTVISIPDNQQKKPFRLQLNATKEILTLTPVGAPIPNRGSEQDDIRFLGLHYFQQVSDALTNEALHLEPGIWLPIPPTTAPRQEATVVRLSTIPHGNSLFAQGPFPQVKDGRPQIEAVDAIPFTIDPDTQERQDVSDPEYLDPFLTTPVPNVIPPISPSASVNPNIVLLNAIQGQSIKNTIELRVSATPVADIAEATLRDIGAITNIPFLVTNAKVTGFAATFWIEIVKNQDDTEHVQLQYSQTAILAFKDFLWPHIAVATLVQQ